MSFHSKKNQKIDFATYLDVVRGIWVAKFIGGTLGAPIEGVKEVHGFTEDIAPEGIAENDDTDLQLLWLHALEEHGPRLTEHELALEWREHVRAPWNEYGVAASNWARGIEPPASGRTNNWFWGECMGCPIRSEIWGVICPGAPELAARYAAMDGSLDHYGEAVEAEKFLAAIEASVFFEKNLDRLIELGLAQINPASRLAQLVADVRVWARTLPWEDTRQRILVSYGHPDMTFALQNVGFTLTGLFAGQGDFGRTLAITLNCGYDADCTGASAGAILGGILGYTGIPARFREAVPETYKISDWMHGFPREGSIQALSEACCHVGREVAAIWQTGVEITGTVAPRPARLSVVRQPAATTSKVKNNFPCWLLVGPFWRAWDERKQSEPNSGEHGCPTLPSVHYFTHNQSGFERDYLSPEQLAFANFIPGSHGVSHWVRQAPSDVIPLDGIDSGPNPACYYAAAEFHAPAVAPVWLMVGATGPVECWLNGVRIIHSETYQPLTPTTFPARAAVQSGRNQLVLKLARTSQPLGAYVAFKRYTGAHWHQSFYETGFEWLQPFAPEPATTESSPNQTYTPEKQSTAACVASIHLVP